MLFPEDVNHQLYISKMKFQSLFMPFLFVSFSIYLFSLLLELSPNISPLCLQYNLSAESAYETAVHSVPDVKNAQTIWLEFLFYKKSQLLDSDSGLSTQELLKSLNDLIKSCLVSVSASRSLPYSTSEVWQDYSFHNQVRLCR